MLERVYEAREFTEEGVVARVGIEHTLFPEERVERELRLQNGARRTVRVEAKSVERRSGDGNEKRFAAGPAVPRVEEPLLDERTPGQIEKIDHEP